MTEEETAEMMADLQAMVPEIDPAMQTIEQNDKTGNLAKAGAKFSKDVKDKLAKAHQSIKDASDHLSSIGFENDENDNDGDESNKSISTNDLSKVMGEIELVKSQLNQVASERDAMEKRIKELEAQPAPGKALLKAIAVDKSADLGNHTDGNTTNSDASLVKNSKGDVDEVASLIKTIHSKGGVVFR